jgi:hypothetical protein
MRRAESPLLVQQGYTVPLVLVLILAVAAFCASALEQAVTDRALGNARLAQQRAFLAASSGINLAARELPHHPPGVLSRDYPLPPPDQVNVETRATVRNALPAGFSAGRFVEQHYEMRGVGRSLRNARSTQTQGFRRIELVEASLPMATP